MKLCFEGSNNLRRALNVKMGPEFYNAVIKQLNKLFEKYDAPNKLQIIYEKKSHLLKLPIGGGRNWTTKSFLDVF